MSDMTACLNDLSYIPLNNGQNKPTQGDIGETSNDPTQAKHNEFEELYTSSNEELCLDCNHVTRLEFMAKFTYFKVKGKLTDSIFNEMLEFFQHVFPTMKGYKLPPSYYAIKKTFKMIGLGYESIHACVNDCFLFRGDNNKDVHFCPVCKTSRWKDSNTLGKKVPKKVLRYFPIIPRLQRLYKSSHTAKEITWHATGKYTEPGKMQHPVDGREWKNFDTKYPNFAKEPRNVRVGLAADGFNLFGNLSQAYSIWPVILTTYNLPPWLCMKESSFMLTLLIPGPKSPGKDIDVYLRPLIDDLKVLWALKGIETIDVATGQKFNMRAMVLWTINDFHARSSLSGWSGKVTRHALHQYLPDEVAKIIIELCSFFKQICSATLMEGDMLKAQSKVVDILCNLELIYPPAFFDIMIHLVIHLPLEALEGGPIRPRWMFSFERFMKKLKGYDVTTKFNRLDRNMDPPPPTCQFQVFRSLCKSIGLRSIIRFDAQELKKVICKFPNKDMKEEFPNWFGSQIRQRHVDNDPGVSATSELFALACGPTPTPILVNSCVDGEMYYGQLQEILEFSYLSFKVVLFRVKWFDTSNEGCKVKHLVLRNNMTQILTKGEAFKDDQYILATQVKQCFYLEDMARRQPHWKVVEHVNHKKFLDGGVIVVEEDPDVIHFDNSSDLPLSTSLNDLDNATLHIDGQSTEVDAPPDIIDLDEDDDIIDDEDALPHDLADSDDEDLVNVDDDDGVDVVYSSEEED
ncbi:reverse transcriptase domain-containing protein [Tanacetum coccineum]